MREQGACTHLRRRCGLALDMRLLRLRDTAKASAAEAGTSSTSGSVSSLSSGYALHTRAYVNIILVSCASCHAAVALLLPKRWENEKSNFSRVDRRCSSSLSFANRLNETLSHSADTLCCVLKMRASTRENERKKLYAEFAATLWFHCDFAHNLHHREKEREREVKANRLEIEFCALSALRRLATRG